jgi:hypothetical protein
MLNPETDTIDVGGHGFAEKRIISIGIQGDGPFGMNARCVR